MPRHILPPRGLGNLRTLGGRGKAGNPPFEAYLRVSFLELERARHWQEMRAARQRLARMAARCDDIDAEKQAILAGLGPAPPSPARSGPPRRGRLKLLY